ncbi:FAD-dependent oxidoreductase, partial [Streptomyces erythrochromogenes]|uniref:FAD-binding oxidoreductase n=1 Tax=Streptomyces erythrochromogenes TaxID=285574 RepID=UPI0036924CEC
MATFDRRAVLRGGASAALASVGTMLLSPPDSTAVPLAPAPKPRNLDERGWDELEHAVDGPVFRKDDANYWALSLPTNHRYAETTPAGILVPHSAADVAESIRWADRNQLPILPRCGGHNYAGFSTTTGLLVHLAALRKVHVDQDAKTLTVQAGCLNRDVFAALKDTDLLLPGGRCPTVGVSGLVLGGGIG